MKKFVSRISKYRENAKIRVDDRCAPRGGWLASGKSATFPADRFPAIFARFFVCYCSFPDYFPGARPPLNFSSSFHLKILDQQR